MSKIIYGEYDNYDYSSADGMSVDEQLSFTKKALKSAISISKKNKNEFWNKKIAEIQLRIKQLEQQKMANY